MTTNTLKFSIVNAKLDALRIALAVLDLVDDAQIYSLSLPSGWTCPGALDCLSKADRITGKVTDGPQTKYRCFAVSMEARSPALRAQVWHNFDLIKAAKTRRAIADLILASMPEDADVIRIHVGGDMFSLAYMGAWLDVATARPNVIFYAYTKSIHHWEKVGALPPNLQFTGSDGGRFDAKLGDRKRSVVVFHPDEADALDLEIDHDDTHAAIGSESFALLIHGTQPKGSAAAAAKKRLTAEKVQFSYS
jgi:hypothetical protein